MKHVLRYFVFPVAILVCLLLVSLTAAAETEGIFTYTVEGEQAKISKIDFSGQTEIHIPETLGGVPVTALENGFMRDTTWIIGDDTVGALYIPKTVTNISVSAFEIADLAKIIVDPENPNYISDESGVLFNKEMTRLLAAPNCMPIQSYTVPDGVTYIEAAAFQFSQFLQTLLLPDTLTSFGSQAFYWMRSLKSLVLPEGITSIGQNDFAYCRSLESVSLPSSLRTIASSAFTECYALKEVIIPEGVTSIGTYAFESDSALERIVLPSSLQTVRQAICGNCPNLKHVYYGGSVEDWAALNVQTGTYAGDRTDAFDVAAFHYNFDVTPYETMHVEFENDALTFSGSGSIPAAGENTFQFWDESKDTVTAMYFDGDFEAVGSEAFRDFPNLSYAIFNAPSVNLAADAFSNCPKLQAVLFFGNAAVDAAAFDTAASTVQVYYPADAAFSFAPGSSRFRTIPFSFADGTLHLGGAVTWDGYQFLDTMTAFCLHFDPIDTITCDDFTFDGLTLYALRAGGKSVRIKDNRLTNAELRAATGEEEDTVLSFNALVNGIADGSITDFRMLAKDEAHEEIKDTPVVIEPEDEPPAEEDEDEALGVAGFIRRAIKWLVRLVDTLMNVLSKFGKKK